MPTEVLRSDTFEQWRVKTNTIGSDLGTKADLSANITANTSLVTAINELQSDIGVVGSLSNFSATNLVGGLNELRNSAITFNGAKTFAENLNVATGRAFTVNGVSVLNATTLGSSVVSSSLTSVGTIGTGTWQGTIISPTYGGTGVNNATRTLTVNTNSGTLAFSGASTTLTIAANASVSGTNTGDQTITLTGDVTGSGTGSFAATLASTGVVAGTYNTVVVNAKGLITSGSNADFSTTSSAQTLTNKSLVDSSTFIIDEADSSRKAQFQVSGIATGQTRTFSLPDVSGTLITSADTGTVSNTMLAGAISQDKLAGSIPNGKLVNSSVTIGSTVLSLGNTATTLAGLSSVASTTFTGNLTGNVTGALTGNASTATVLANARSINGVAFDGSANITVTAAAGTLTGATLASGVTASSLTSVGTLSALTVSGTANLGATIVSGPNVETDVLTVRNASAADKFTVDTLGNVYISGNLQVVGTTTIAATNLTLEWADILSKPDPVVTVNLTGPVTGTGNTTLTDLTSGTIAIATTIANDSITLGTKTVGDYVAAVTGNTEVVVTGGTGEGSTAALTIGSAIARRADTTFVGTTSIALNRASANQALAGITSVTLPGSTSGSVQVLPAAIAGTGTVLTLPATTGTVITSGDSATVTNAMLAGSIANAKLANSTISGVSLGGTLATLTLGDGLDGTSYNGSTAVTASVASTVARRADTTFVGTTSIALNRTSANQALTGITSVTLPGATSGTVQLIPTAAVGTGTILTIPATTGTIITTGDSATVTNAMLAGSIANAKLVNSSVTVTAGTGLAGGGSVSLGGSVTLSHGSVTAAASVDNTGGTVIQDLTFDTFGHVTGTASVNLDSRYLQAEADTLNSVVGRGATTATAITVGGLTTSGTVATGVLTTSGNATIGGDLNITGNLAVSGTTTTINTETINLADNNIVLNSNYVGSAPTENCGISVNRGGGTAPNKILEWNESVDKWSVGSETFIAGTFEGNLTGNAATATSAARLTTARTINGVSFDGTTNITIPSTTSGALTVGTGIVFATGSNFDGSVARQISIDATVVATLTGSQAFTSKTYNGLSLSALTTGFSVAGGTTSKTLTVSNTITLAAGNDTSTLNIGTGGTLGSAAFTATSAYATAAQGTKADNAAAVSGIVKSNADGTFTGAVAGTDYVAPAALSGYATAAQGTKADNVGAVNGIIKSNGTATFSAAVAGTDYVVPSGSITGNAGTATTLQTARTINGTSFNGSANITITANTTNALTVGSGLALSAGTTFNGSAAVTITNAGVTGITGTTNQVVASAATGSVTLSLPQSINTGANVQFGSLGIGTPASATAGEIRATNNVTAYYSSDERLKTNVRKIQGALESVSKIDGVIYDWNETYLADHGDVDGYFVRQNNSGVIAQQVEKVFPHVVADREDGYKAVRYELLVPLLIEAIKELKAEIEVLKAR